MVSAIQERPCQEMDIIGKNVTLLIKAIVIEFKSLVAFPLLILVNQGQILIYFLHCLLFLDYNYIFLTVTDYLFQRFLGTPEYMAPCIIWNQRQWGWIILK